jgi:hypothetical protein
MAWFFVAAAAHAKPALRLAELPDSVVRTTEVHRERNFSFNFTIEDTQHGESALLLVTTRAAQLAEPRGRVPSFVPALSTTCIGGSLRVDF